MVSGEQRERTPGAERDNPAARRRRFQAVLNDARRHVERDARVAHAAEDLASAAEALLAEMEATPGGPEPPSVRALRAALTRFREASRG